MVIGLHSVIGLGSVNILNLWCLHISYLRLLQMFF